MSSAKKKPAPERMHYIDGYIPVAYNSPHSSLERSATWLGMGLLLSSLAGIGAVLFAIGANSVGQQQDTWTTYAIIGAVFAVVSLVLGTVLIVKGRAGYRRYVKETGRTQ
ncbi:hypothetical protein CDES_02080 [Corynebacterium deserti GIMN1.010]|uniref:Uncharacterized protein n=1 Tax=Corynebacterium deserti GIMN1.010 TaxID=931089 RepID=A0A0M4CCD7_9CORY|nr:hypothetical protein [Corynebacterium deserti]ALC04878.1 hypothetical protein CDES_02080 [Corynebacterium deserti GIMN1.010]